MKFFFDLFPVLLFFVAYKFGNIFIATGVAIAASIAQIAWLLLRRRKVDAMLWMSLAIILVFGGATLAFHNETFIKWKPTVLYWLFAAVLFGGRVLFNRNLIRVLMEKQIAVPEAVWQKLNASWIGFFIVMGCVNLFFAYNFSTDTWVNFKLFGALGMMFVFVLLQGLWLSRHIEETEESR